MVYIESILIVEPFDIFRNDLKRKLEKNFRVFTCGDGNTGLELLMEHRPEGLVLNLSLPGMDGLSFLEAIRDCRPDAILTLSPAYPPYVLQTLMKLGVGYSLLIPCTEHTVAHRITDMMRQTRLAGPLGLQEEADRLLKLLGAPYRDSYQMLSIGIALFAQDPSLRMTKELYPAIATLCNCNNWQQVEFSIRGCIQFMWKNRDPEVWETFFPSASGCPSNKHFIARLSEMINWSK